MNKFNKNLTACNYTKVQLLTNSRTSFHRLIRNQPLRLVLDAIETNLVDLQVGKNLMNLPQIKEGALLLFNKCVWDEKELIRVTSTQGRSLLSRITRISYE